VKNRSEFFRYFVKPALVLTLMTLFSAAIIGFTHMVTSEPIRIQRENAEMEAILALLPDMKTMEYAELEEADSSLTRLTTAFGRDGEILGYVFSAMPAGYSGRINMMVAFDPAGVIQGVRIINHSETPGLGANITQDWFLTAFSGKVGVVVSADVPVIASSTISVNAVLRGVNDAARYFEENLP